MTRKVVILVVAALLLLGVGFGVGRHSVNTDPGDVVGNSYPLLAKRTLINNPADPIINFTALRLQLNSYIVQHKISGSLFFEYLPTGTTIGINSDVDWQANSLLKIPAAMELYKAAEEGKINLDNPISLKTIWLDSDYGTLYLKGAGYALTLRNATKIMLEQSDDTALNAVSDSTSGLLSADNRVFNAVDIGYTPGSNLGLSVSARSYSSLLKCLYFSCYLSHDDSQQLLGYLAHTPFNARIVAGIANPRVTVAHKIGVLGDANQSDCGIVYLTNRNYVLCMIVNGPDDNYVDKYMADMSHQIYSYLSVR